MPYAGRHVPHAVVEVNQRCNISCHACYKDKSTFTKPLDRIKAEIDIAAAERRLAVLTLAGGEPILHPQLPEVVSFVASRGISPQLLSNGLALTAEKLHELRARGLSRIYLHVDSLQRRPDAPRHVASESELDPLREAIAARVTSAGLKCALSLTLYRNRNLRDIANVVRFVLKSPRFDRLLVTCCTDFAQIASELVRLGKNPELSGPPPADLRDEVVTTGEVARILEDELGLEPYAYVASSKNLAARRWIFYYAFVLHLPDGTSEVLPFDASFGRVVGAGAELSRLLKGTYPIEQHVTRAGAVALCLAYAASSGDAAVVARTLRFLSKLRHRGARLVQKSLVFQQGPNVTPEGELEICKDCPDATVRDGRLVPVCLADVLCPL
jgi:hypothetical protein